MNRHASCFGILSVVLYCTSVQALDTTILHSFTGGASDGANPAGSLILAGSELYGITGYGGANSEGTVFTLHADGTGFRVLHAFAGSASDGECPTGSLSFDGSTLYGVTASGGSSDRGTIFSIAADGTGFRLLHSFATAPDYGFGGYSPYAGITLSGSKLYGTTIDGGSTTVGGVVYSIDTSGDNYRVLHSFDGTPMPGYPKGALTINGSKVFGTTAEGGQYGGGIAFSMNMDGTDFVTLHSFNRTTEGGSPYGSLCLDGTKLYGTTDCNWPMKGSVFSMAIDGTGFTVLHTFAGGATDGGNPFEGVTLSGETLYGMTSIGGSSDVGVLFSLQTDGSDFQILHSFAGPDSDGATPVNGLTFDGSTVYGMTGWGGTADNGTIFSVTIPEPSTLALLNIGAISLLAYAWRRRKRTA